MRSSLSARRYLSLAVASFGLLALLAVAAVAQDDPDVVGTINITLTNDGISQSAVQPTGGLYLVTVTNDSSRSRGLVMKGIDLCCSPYTRFTKVLAPGQSETFRWFFPPDREVVVRDLLRCGHAERTCALPLTGMMSTSINFG